MITSPTVVHILDCDLKSDEMTLKNLSSHTTTRSTSFVIRIFFAELVRPDFSTVEDEVGSSLLTIGVLGELVRADTDGGKGPTGGSFTTRSPACPVFSRAITCAPGVRSNVSSKVLKSSGTASSVGPSSSIGEPAGAVRGAGDLRGGAGVENDEVTFPRSTSSSTRSSFLNCRVFPAPGVVQNESSCGSDTAGRVGLGEFVGLSSTGTGTERLFCRANFWTQSITKSHGF